MANITVRNIPDGIFKKIKALSSIEKRSLNNEILMILERGLLQNLKKNYMNGNLYLKKLN
jgi:plasmid stability protein